jgi:hypothetical protein
MMRDDTIRDPFADRLSACQPVAAEESAGRAGAGAA